MPQFAVTPNVAQVFILSAQKGNVRMKFFFTILCLTSDFGCYILIRASSILMTHPTGLTGTVKAESGLEVQYFPQIPLPAPHRTAEILVIPADVLP